MSKNVFIIAEISANHGNDIEIVKDTMKKAKEIGADAVKIQTYTADTITLDTNSEDFIIRDGSIWNGRNLHDLYKEGSLPFEWHQELFDFARENNIVLFSTPFDNSAVDLLEEVGNPIYKIASFEANDVPLIKYCASKNKPMIISTGIATEDEIERAVKACIDTGNTDITLLKCTSQYPAQISDANMEMMNYFKEKFNVKVGLSDHTIGSTVPIVATALGAEVIEKHFILDREIGGPDASFSMTPEEFGQMVKDVRDASNSLGEVSFELTEKKKKSRTFRRSLYISNDVSKGDIVSDENIKSVRPGYGLNPLHYEEVIGMKFKGDFKKGDRLSLDKLEE
ncbi:MAG: pseudaminic acid synthase [Bacilli bacterium]